LDYFILFVDTVYYPLVLFFCLDFLFNIKHLILLMLYVWYFLIEQKIGIFNFFFIVLASKRYFSQLLNIKLFNFTVIELQPFTLLILNEWIVVPILCRARMNHNSTEFIFVFWIFILVKILLILSFFRFLAHNLLLTVFGKIYFLTELAEII
jgi:hypothetical protein